MRVVIGDRFRRWSSSSIAFRRWVTGILLVTHNSSVRPSPHSPRNRRQFLAREASAAVGGFVHPQITLAWRLPAASQPTGDGLTAQRLPREEPYRATWPPAPLAAPPVCGSAPAAGGWFRPAAARAASAPATPGSVSALRSAA